MPGDDAESVLESVGANVRRERVRLGLTQEGLAERADVDLRFLQRVEQGRTNLSVRTLCALAGALAVNPGSLLSAATVVPPRRGRPPKV